MTDAVITVNRMAVTPAMKAHPLATQGGLTMLSHLIEADRVWTSCTKPQRALLAELCPQAVEVLLERGGLAADEMPLLPARVTTVSREALRRRGLLDDADRLTGCAVHAWFYAGRLKAVSAEDSAGIAEDVAFERTQDAATRYQEDPEGNQ